MPKTIYVSMVVIDPVTGFSVGITKLKGPAHLLKKVTFPGGKIEAGESPEEAATREMLEETGIAIPVQDWTVVDVLDSDERTLHVMGAVSHKVLYARQCEEEPVWHLNIERHVEYSARQVNEYAPDFRRLLIKAVEVLTAKA